MAKETAQAMDYLDQQDQDGDSAVSGVRSEDSVMGLIFGYRWRKLILHG